jgi:hypothetical protein
MKNNKNKTSKKKKKLYQGTNQLHFLTIKKNIKMKSLKKKTQKFEPQIYYVVE